VGGTPVSPAQAADALTSAAKPFFITVTLGSPLAQSIPQKNLDLYTTAGFEATGFEPAAANATHKDMLRDARVNLRKYAGGVTTLDDQVGALMADLQKHGLWENTVTVFTSGHGFLAGHHGLWGDGLASDPVNMYEEVMRVPMIWTWPGHFPPGSVRPDVVSADDVLATLGEITGAPQASRSCGRSYMPFIYNQHMPKKQPWRGLAFSRFRNVQMARDDRYKLVLREGGPNELYDEATDPAEKVNQYDNPQFVSVRDRFTSELKGWRGPCAGTLIDLKTAPG